MHHPKNITIIIPVHKNTLNLSPLLAGIDTVFGSKNIPYEIILCTPDKTLYTNFQKSNLQNIYPVKLITDSDNISPRINLDSITNQASSPLICFLNSGYNYPPEVIAEIYTQMQALDADILIAGNKGMKLSPIQKLNSYLTRQIAGRLIHKLDQDSDLGLFILRRKVLTRVCNPGEKITPGLELLLLARNAGYKIMSTNLNSVKNVRIKHIYSRPVIIEVIRSIKLKLSQKELFPFYPDKIRQKGYGFNYRGREFIHHTTLKFKNSAFQRFSEFQIIAIIIFIEILLAGFILNWHLTLVIFIAGLTTLYFADLLFNLFLVYRSYTLSPDIKINDHDIQNLNGTGWPAYTVLCPLYKEWKILPQFVKAMDNLDYPKDKLQILLLLEEDDRDTIEIVKKLELPSYFEYLIVPHSKPKTKPKASNYGLRYARGEYVVIYDAEDIPDQLQLKKAIMAFREAGPKTICVQAKLNFYNPRQNLLTRLFTAEYSLWFDLVLTGLQTINAPIPLGGTSNHFRVKDLLMLRAWDSFNVTEDADLGMRIAKNGYKTALIDSVTLEEANSSLSNWISQRSRWIKGYIQTYFVHMREPREFLKNKNSLHFFTFQLIIGGKVLSMLINPLMWMITISYFIARPLVGSFIESFYPTPVLYMAIFSILIGNFLYLYYYMLGCIKRDHDDLVKYALLIPFYWLAMSWASFIAIYKFIVSPHYWAKTKHGLHMNTSKNSKYIAREVSMLLKKIKSISSGNITRRLSVSICIPAYNEGKNIRNILKALSLQLTTNIRINKIVVVSSGSTDNTDRTVLEMASYNPKIRLIRQEKRQGKAAAINAFLNMVDDEVVVIESADTIPRKNTIQKLCEPFLKDEKIGMTGGAPVPVNDPNTFLGYIIHAWWWFHRNIPRFGEIIAYRNIIRQINETTAVDEAYIQAKMVQLGYSIIHVNDAVVQNKGAETISDLIKQRRRVMNGHARLHKKEGIKIDNMTKSSLRLLLFKYKMRNLKEFFWLLGGIGIEIYARILGAVDYRISGKNPFVWDIASTTKDISSDPGIRMEVSQK